MFFRPKCRLPPNPWSSKYFRMFGLWLFIILLFYLLFCPFTTRPACALKIIPHMRHYYVSKGSSVTLNCEFSFASENMQRMEIEWNIVPPNREENDKIIIWLTGGMIYNNLYDPLKGRVHFTSPDPQNGNASLTIHDLRLTDTGTYQCKVKKLPELDIKNMILNVMERPSKPVCYIEGEATAGERVVLRCRSSQGTPPLRYRWSKTSGNQMLHRDAFVDTTGGAFYLPKMTLQDCGTYRCTVESLVGMDDCEVTLSITSPQTTNYGLEATAAAVPTVVVVIIAAITVICFCCRKRQSEELFSNDILEEELPPLKWPRAVHRHLVVYNKVDEGFERKDEEMRQEDKVFEEQDLTTLTRHGSMDGRLNSEDKYTDDETIEKEFTPVVIHEDTRGMLKSTDKEMWQEP